MPFTIRRRALAAAPAGAQSGAMTRRSRVGSAARPAAAEWMGPQPDREPWVPGEGSTVLLVSAAPTLQGAVGRVCAAAAVDLVVVDAVDRIGTGRDGIAAILIGSDVRGGLAGWRGPTVVVGPAGDAGEMWTQAARLGADRVAVLPESAQWLANHLTRLRNPAATAGVVGIVGGCGGSGASTLAALVAAGAAGRGIRTLLVDGDGWGGGLEVALAAEAVPGLRWPDLLRASGAINPEQLAASLPESSGFSLLSRASGAEGAGPGPAGVAAAAAEVMRAARGGFGLVVVDLGRSPDSLDALGVHCDGFVVVVPARLRAAAAAACLVARLPAAPAGLVVRGPLAEGIDAGLVAGSVGVPGLGVLPRLRRVDAALAAGRVADLVRRRPVGLLVGDLVHWLMSEGAPGGTGGLGSPAP